MNKRLLLLSTIVVVIVFGIVGTVWIIRQNRPFTCNKTTCVASINNQPIKLSDYHQAVAEYQHFQNWVIKNSSQSAIPQENVLNDMIDTAIITQYAKEHNIRVSDSEVQARYNQAVQAEGSEERYLQKLKEVRDFDKSTILNNMRQDILKEKIQQVISEPLDTWLTEQKKTQHIVTYQEQ